ncbi:hypothetical protein SAMN04488146_1256 [Bacillus nitratireducens]|nr:hypothetical protein SAMN04488146_1256 [Bacillus nitratireducens]
MNISIQSELQLIAEELQRHMSPHVIEHLECHLYGQLISILLCSSTMFKMRQLLLDKKKKEPSECKSIYMIKNYYLLFYEGLQKDIHELSKVLLCLFYLLEKNERKSSLHKHLLFHKFVLAAWNSSTSPYLTECIVYLSLFFHLESSLD